jgi:hypothetical protein
VGKGRYHGETAYSPYRVYCAVSPEDPEPVNLKLGNLLCPFRLESIDWEDSTKRYRMKLSTTEIP